MNPSVEQLKEALRVVSELSYHQANNSRLSSMDVNNAHPEVAEMKLRNSICLMKAMVAAKNNPLAKAAILEARKSNEE